MEVKEILDKEVWESFLLKQKEKSFLDSWNWGEFQRKMEGKIWRLGVYEKDSLVSLALIVKVKAKRGTFFFVPHGPVCSNVQRKEILEVLSKKLKELAKEEKVSFIRMSPIWERTEKNKELFKRLKFRDAPIHIHPENSWELDLSFSEEELLKKMRKTTRYLIRQADKNPEIEIVKSNNPKDLNEFSKILNETAQRHHFVPFSLNYLEKQFSSFSADDQIVIYLGKYKGELVSSAVVIYWQGIGFYHHGASLQKYNSNKVPVTYLQQWEAIKEAKRRNCLNYNFWGIAEDEEDKKHPWHGLTLFKKGFGGYRKDYVKTQDLPLSKKYFLTRLFEKARKIKRGL